MSDNRKHVILLMEDDEVLRRYLAKLLRADGFEVIEAGSVKEAIECARTPELNLVVADLKMPDDTAIGLMKKLSEQHIDIPVIIITAFGEWETYLEALDLGVCDYLNKPIEYAEFKEKIKLVLAKNGQRKHKKKPVR
ncbi:MAG: response regulator [Candidatus Omnitrophica bacterium]|nr:response regulator [Candidatus Omnitrophota bacterium]MBU4479050.1 response regulator [Candidatus Omnitrophota bacterium]MCG2702757.1 response regulator [Candidatus Omnitrophota bacterium]